jgi:16S rRNA (guanine(966)-N(2))-methyltransferase RsmD
MKLRISGGRLKGRRLRTGGLSRKSSLRPSASKVREAIFDIIGADITGSVFLDLYAGTGAVGFEALSRGAEYTVFVETDPGRVELIRKTSEEFGFPAQVRVYRMPVISYLRNAINGGESFDFIFADPPYQSEEIDRVLQMISAGSLLKRDGMVIVEHSSKRSMNDIYGGLQIRKRYRYGDTSLTTYKSGEVL